MIKVKNLDKSFSTFQLFQNLNLFIDENEFVFLVGPSGSGKSTLLKMMFCADSPDSGQIFIDKVDLSTLKRQQIPYLRRNIGFVFQDFKLLKNRSVFENVAFAMQIMNFSRVSLHHHVKQALELVNLMHRAEEKAMHLSGGEQQRLCIARAIVNHPPVLLADEPTGNLDPEASLEIMRLLRKINARKTTVLVATHDHKIVDMLRQRVIVLNQGYVVRDEQFSVYKGAIS